MHLVEVTTPAQEKIFIELQQKLYKGVENYIRPLDNDIKAVFDKEKNKLFRQEGTEVIRWILEDSNGKAIGRVAAFVNGKIAHKEEQPTGGMGFFECINDKVAAEMLLTACQTWLTERGMEAMDGPINFGERDAWWGLLVEGFDIDPNYRTNYHLPYYQQFFEDFGFQIYFKQYTYGRRIVGEVDAKMDRKANMIDSNPDYRFEYLKKKQLPKFTQDFVTIYNNAWAGHGGVAEITLKEATSLMGQFKPILDEQIMWFGYHKEKPVAFFICLPEINQIIKHVNGKLDLIGKAKFKYHQLRGTCRKALGLVFGVVKEHQGKGMDGAIIKAFQDHTSYEYKRYDDFEMNWIGDFNPKMMLVARQIKSRIVKTHHTYRKLFDETKEFKRMARIK
ncbi:MAG: hypothetical protein ACI85I_002731 [Arenicella sp.]|jgi:hypothetical protein